MKYDWTETRGNSLTCTAVRGKPSTTQLRSAVLMPADAGCSSSSSKMSPTVESVIMSAAHVQQGRCSTCSSGTIRDCAHSHGKFCHISEPVRRHAAAQLLLLCCLLHVAPSAHLLMQCSAAHQVRGPTGTIRRWTLSCRAHPVYVARSLPAHNTAEHTARHSTAYAGVQCRVKVGRAHASL